MMKVYDCQDMPEDVRNAFFASCDHDHGNDCLVTWNVFSLDVEEYGDNHFEVSNWLLANGADDNEDVVIKHWW